MFFKNACVSLFVIYGLLSPAAGLSQENDYRIGPRDVLSLVIYAGGELQHDLTLTVSAEGNINVPFIGPSLAEGLTINQLESMIKKPLAEDYFVDPEINIAVKEYHSLRYYISGAVKAPGVYKTPSKFTLMELIAKAGGLLPERGNVAYLLRAAAKEITGEQDVKSMLSMKEPEKVDLVSLLDKGDMSQNMVLHSGDVVYIPREKVLDPNESKIYIEGQIKNSGVYDYQPGLTAMNACIMAGGFDKFAAPNRTRIIRKKGEKQIVIKLNLNAVKAGKIKDFKLKPGDRIHVPETWL